MVPEVLFFTTPLMMQSINGKSFSKLSSWLIDYSIFFDQPNCLLLIIGIEALGIIGLLIMNFKMNRNAAHSLPITILLVTSLGWLLYIFALVYGTSQMTFF